MIRNFFDTIRFNRDAALVKNFTGATLTKEHFAIYKDAYTLRKVIGSNSTIYRQYYCIGQSGWDSTLDVMNTILSTLYHRSGIAFDIETPGNNDALFENMIDKAGRCLTQGNWPRIPAPYDSSVRLNESVKQIRAIMKLSYVENALR